MKRFAEQPEDHKEHVTWSDTPSECAFKDTFQEAFASFEQKETLGEILRKIEETRKYAFDIELFEKRKDALEALEALRSYARGESLKEKTPEQIGIDFEDFKDRFSDFLAATGHESR